MIERLKDGFHIKANPKKPAADWPMDLRLRFAYANGSARPSWSRFDFKTRELNVVVSNAKSHSHFESEKEKKTGLNIVGCDNKFSTIVTGFDSKRELVVFHQPVKSDGQEDG